MKISFIYFIIALAIIAADRLAKGAVASSAKVGETIASVPGVEIIYVKNTGAAFSFMSGRVSLLAIVSIVFCIAAVVYWIVKKPRHYVMCTAVAMMFAGALGNAIDRISLGFVIDFIRVTFIDFPVFNIADIAITSGAALLIIYEIFFDRPEKQICEK